MSVVKISVMRLTGRVIGSNESEIGVDSTSHEAQTAEPIPEESECEPVASVWKYGEVRRSTTSSTVSAARIR